MNVNHFLLSAVGLLVWLKEPPKRDERGISQSTESAILLAGAVAVALLVVLVVRRYVTSKLSDI